MDDPVKYFDKFLSKDSFLLHYLSGDKVSKHKMFNFKLIVTTLTFIRIVNFKYFVYSTVINLSFLMFKSQSF